MSDSVRISDLTDDELRDAAVQASALILIQSAKDYGFVTGGPEIDVDRCEEAIAAARERGLIWNSAETEAVATQWPRPAAASAVCRRRGWPPGAVLRGRESR